MRFLHQSTFLLPMVYVPPVICELTGAAVAHWVRRCSTALFLVLVINELKNKHNIPIFFPKLNCAYFISESLCIFFTKGFLRETHFY